MPVTGLMTLDERPPAIWFSASSSTTIKPSDQTMSIEPILLGVPKLLGLVIYGLAAVGSNTDKYSAHHIFG